VAQAALRFAGALTESLAAEAAFIVAEVAAATFDSAKSTACLAALENVSYAVLAAANGALQRGNGGSEPAGAFFAAKSISCVTFLLFSAICDSTMRETSVPAPLAMPYTVRE